MITLSNEPNREEVYWTKALEQSKIAVAKNSLTPLKTKIIKVYPCKYGNFELRCITSEKPFHLIKKSKINNPFLPWDKDLEVSHVNRNHTLILNKYPVQIGHMLLITNTWAPQNGWLNIHDWEAIEIVDKDTSGLWFFNSCPQAGASQPHRHIQLLRRHYSEIICPRNNWFMNYSTNEKLLNRKLYNSAIVLKKDSLDDSNSLYKKYLKAAEMIGLGNPNNNLEPLKPYNLIITKDWIALIRRSSDGLNGFSINALGFAGYLLATSVSKISWLDDYGPEYLLQELVDPYK